MKKGRAVLRWIGVAVVMCVCVVYGVEAYGVGEPPKALSQGRPDAITLDAPKAFGALEYPPVVFLHDTHTEALKKIKKDCQECHPKDPKKDLRSVRFKRLDDPATKTELRDLYHDGCVGCHQALKGQTEKTGPVACRECHGDRGVQPAQAAFGLDKNLHFRHALSQRKGTEDKCDTCHHEFDKKTEKLVYVKGKEGACLYCHKDRKEENRIPMQQAAHQSCLECHLKTAAAGKEAGPVICAGCHDPATRAKIKKVDPIERVKRNQPDTTLIKTGVPAAPDKPQPLKMKAVPFDHQAHEKYNDSCKVCHHAELKPCSGCHTVAGSKDGNFVRLETALHEVRSDRSCVGCHQKRQQVKNCAGCHGQTPPARLKETQCDQCHQIPLDQTPAPTGQNAEARVKELAKEFLAARKPVLDTYADEDIPEKVTIGWLSKEYQPAEFPHRKIVQTIAQGFKDRPLAHFFHADPGTLCQGCHHNSPPAKKPPQCLSCHGKPFSEAEPLRPGSTGAYHLQCMNCHHRMEVQKPGDTACVECHKKKEM